MSAHFHAATGECALCDGPCRQPFKLPPIHSNYPFLPQEVIAMTNEPDEQQPASGGRRARRARRRGEDRATRPSEDRTEHPIEDR